MALEFVSKLPYDHPYRWDGTAVGGVKLWRPDELGAALALWLDAEDTSTITLNGSNVSQWRDKSGNGNNAAQAVAVSQPARVTDGLQFDGTADYMDITTANIKTLTQPFVYAMVVNLNSGLTFKPSADGINNQLHRVVAGNEGAGDNDGMYSGSAVNASTQVTATAVRVYNFNGSSSSYFRNGISVASGDSGTQNPSSGIRLGADHDLSGPNYSNILFNEFVVVDATLSTADRQKVEGYLAWKWGLTANLPVSHPYKLIPPYVGVPVYDADAQAYFNRVEGPTGDNQTLEAAVKTAINDFVVGCKADGIWNAIKSSTILAGARTLSGALQPLAGTAPTNFNFVSGDYNRKTGLKGDGSTKYLNCNIAHNHTSATNRHASVFATFFSGNGSLLTTGNTANADDLYRAANLSIFRCTSNVSTTATIAEVSTPTFQGLSRSSSSTFDYRAGGVSGVENLSAGTTTSSGYNLLRLPTATFYGAHRIAFYSIGGSLDLAALDTRVSALMTALDGAIA